MNEDGQSTIEFIFSFMIAIFTLLLFVKMAVNFTNGYLVHYATFVASRAYLVYDNNSNDPSGSDSRARQFAKTSFDLFKLTDFGIKADGDLRVNDAGNVGSSLNYEYVGAYFDFKQRFSFSNIVGGTQQMNLRSESFLGREPTKATCLQQICKAFNDVDNFSCSFPSSGLLLVTAYDNGC